MKYTTIFLDIDGVLADFAGSSIRAHGRSPIGFRSMRRAPWEIADWLGVSVREFWDTIDTFGEYFWVGLDKMPWFYELLSVCHYVSSDVHLLTSPSLNPLCLSGKSKWLSGNGLSSLKVTYTNEKWRLAKPGTVLIDDNDSNCLKFTSAGGSSILFPANYNENYRLARSPMSHVVELLLA